jgi:hypothetical protein
MCSIAVLPSSLQYHSADEIFKDRWTTQEARDTLCKTQQFPKDCDADDFARWNSIGYRTQRLVSSMDLYLSSLGMPVA